MLEVCFNDSVKGALILAQHCEDNLIGGAVSVISNRKGLLPFFSKRKAIKEYRRKYEKLQNSAISLGGVKEDIIGVSFALSEGCFYCKEGAAFSEYRGACFVAAI